MLLGAMVMGASALNRNTKNAVVPLAERPPDERVDYAFERRDWPLANAALREMIEADQFDARSIFYLAYVLQQQKKFDEARTWYHKAAEFRRYRWFCEYNLACMCALEGNDAEALSHLKTAIEGGFASRRGIERDNDFKHLANDPEFKRLVELEKENAKRRR